ncbi:hypothetical protein BKA83DRAFT_4132890 [Pisolithus microcarpus]|nr:hypothetical protein BKA83DRAFT_4132889 [Pisolithus microcarpus]KAI6010207.1 hypothetical protein BKA83DRAFT_4132890 [Pisolithus microcarpus]
MGVEIPQLPEWDFSMTIKWQWRISNWSFGDSPWVWRFSNCQNGTSPILLWGDGESPIGQLEILHGCGDSPNSRMGFPHDYYVAMENLQLLIWGFSMGVEIPQLPEWDFSNSLMGGWGISNCALGDSPWVWRFPNCQNGFSPSLLCGDGDSPSGKLWILHGHGDSPNSRMGFPHDYYVAMENLQLLIWGFSMGVEILQLVIWRFSMGVEIPQLPEWDFSNSLMGGWGISNWAVGDSPIARIGLLQSFYGGMGNFQSGGCRFSMGVEIPQLPEWVFSIPLMGAWGMSNWAVGNSPWVWRFSKCQNEISPPL